MIGEGRCPVIDTWWQTETGTIMLAPMPGAVPTKPGSATRPFLGIEPAVWNREGEIVPAGGGGLLSDPQALAFHGAHQSSMILTAMPGRTGRIGYGSCSAGMAPGWTTTAILWLMGRVDDVINVSGT